MAAQKKQPPTKKPPVQDIYLCPRCKTRHITTRSAFKLVNQRCPMCGIKMGKAK